MIFQNLKFAFRRLKKQKHITITNFLGLSIGFTCFIAVGLYVIQEWSYDRFHVKNERIYRLDKVSRQEGEADQRHSVSCGAITSAIENALPTVEQIVRLRPWFTDMLVCRNETNCQTFAGVTYADDGFFQMFDFPLISGDPTSVLSQPFSIVLTEKTAAVLFGNENPIGKQLNILHNMPVTVTGVAADPPPNSHIQFSALVSWSSTFSPAYLPKFSFMNNWLTQVNYTYVLLREGADPAATKPKFVTLLEKNLPERAKSYEFYLQPIADIHLKTADVLYAEPTGIGNGSIVTALALVGLFVLLIACFNYFNMSSVGAQERLRSVGVLKILGSSRWQIVGQFCLESLLLGITALICAWFTIQAALPWCDRVFDLNLTQSFIENPQVLMFMAVGMLGIVMLAGLFPALTVGRIRTTDAVKNGLGKEPRITVFWRGSLVTLQFVFSILLIIGTLVVGRQTVFVLEKDLGFNREQLCAIQVGNTAVEEKSSLFIEKIRQHTGIVDATLANRAIWHPLPGYGIIPEGRTEADALQAKCLDADAHFAKTYGLRLLSGRLPDPTVLASDSSALLVNETFARTQGWTAETALDKQVEIVGEQRARIVGVLHDFYATSLREEVEPTMIQMKHNPIYITLKIRPSQTTEVLDFCKTQWQEIEPKHPFDFAFAEDRIQRFYQSDLRLLGLLRLFAGFAVFVACLGLLSLTAHAVQRRTKEIGIRKVLGASVAGVTGLLTKDFVKLVLIALLIASPLAYYFMEKWLSDFAYRIEMEWWMFAGAGVLAVLIAFLTVSFQSVKAALANPVESLRSE